MKDFIVLKTTPVQHMYVCMYVCMETDMFDCICVGIILGMVVVGGLLFLYKPTFSGSWVDCYSISFSIYVSVST